MKNFIFAFAVVAATCTGSQAQTPPQAFSYQALVRDGAGAAVRNQAVRVRIRLHQDSANAIVSYAETFTPTTNGFGNINLSIGRGTVALGTFLALDWSRPMYVEIGVDPAGGTAYVDLGTTQLLSVPYALFSGKSAIATGGIKIVAAGNGLLGGGSADSVKLTVDTSVIQVRVGGGCLSNQFMVGVNANGTVICASSQSTTEIHDADNNTKVSTERNANENIIRFDLSGTEKMRLRGNALEFPNTGLSVYLGDSAGASASSADHFNVFVGYQAGKNSGLGDQNTFIGYTAGYSNTNGTYNTFLGNEAGFSTTSGGSNTFSGSRAGYTNTSGFGNTFTGYNAGINNTTANGNTFTGHFSGHDNDLGSFNTFSGYQSGSSNRSGYQNTFSGYQSGYTNNSGYQNTFLGTASGYSNISGYFNVYSGYQAGYNNSTGSDNVMSGVNAGSQATSGSSNTYLGGGAGRNNYTGSWNTFVGNSAGQNNGGNKNTLIGSLSSTVSGADSMSVAIGYNARAFGSNRLAIDNSNTSAALIAGDFSTNLITVNGDLTVTGTFLNPSDRRLKENIVAISNVLENVGKINGVYYDWKMSTNPDNIRGKGRQVGVIAQDVEKVYPELVSTTSDGFKAVDYPKLTAVLIEAVKEQQKTIEALKAENREMAAWKLKVDAALRLSGKTEDKAEVAGR